ncbi:hypothetical protein LCGC14_2887480, partial [marine sediment metagenome]
PMWSPWTQDTKARLCYVAGGIYTFHVKVKDSSGRVGAYWKSRTFRGTAQSKVCNGALLRGSAPDVFITQRGLKRHVVSRENFIARGFSWSDVMDVSDSFLNSIPTGEPLLSARADGNLLRGRGSGVYVMEAGVRRHITSPSALADCGYGWDAIYVISDSILNSIATGSSVSGLPCPHLSPPDGTLVRGSSGAIYVMRRGLKRHIPNPATLEAYGYLWGNVNHIPDSTLAGIPTGEPLLDALADGNLLRGGGSGVYVMEAGVRRHITSPSALVDCGYGRDAVFVISNSPLNSVPTGDPLSGPPCPHLSPPDGILVKGTGSAAYVMQQGLKRHVPNLATFAAQGFLWGNVNNIPDSTLGAIPTGEPLLDALADGNLLKGSGSAIYVMQGGL